MLLSQLAEDFYDHILAERGGSENTVVAYRSTIDRLVGFLSQQGVEAEFNNVTTALLRKFVVHLKGSGIRGSTVARHIHGLKSFWRYVVETYELQGDATLPLKTPRVEHRIPDILSEGECQRLLDACEENHFSLYRIRDRSILKLMMILGLRRGEVIRLRRSDFNPEAGTLKIVDSKNRKSRLLPVPDGVERDMREWLRERPECDHDHLFCSRQGSALNPRAIYRMMDRVVDAAKIEGKNVHPHMLRHTAATMALRNSGDLLATQHLLGHSDPSVTRIYCHLTADDIRRTMKGNPLSATGHGSQETSGFGTAVSEQAQEHLAELDVHLQKMLMEYDALLEANPDIRERWRRLWIADWCRHAFAEPWPMSLPDAMSVVWEDQPVGGTSISTLAGMKTLKELLLAESRTASGVPTDIGGWLLDVYPHMRPCSPESSPQAPLKHIVPVLVNIVNSPHECDTATAIAIGAWSAATGDDALAVCGDLLTTMTVSRGSVFPVYRCWPQAAQIKDGKHRGGTDLLMTRIERTMSMIEAMLAV